MSSSKNDPFRSKRKRSKPIPIWPVVMGPVLGMVGSLVIGMAFRERKAPALTASDHMWKAVSGLGVGLFLGLLAMVMILLERDADPVVTTICAVAAVVVLLAVIWGVSG